jgi:two-component system sensor kinase FixL
VAIRLLVVEDSAADFLLLQRHLREHGLSVDCQRVDSDAGVDAALQERWDLVLSDYDLPGMDFRAVLQRIQARQPELPVILVSGSVGEETAVELLHLGLADFVHKDGLTRLLPAMHRALEAVRDRAERKHTEQALVRAEAQYRAVIETAADGFWMLDEQGRILAVNDAYARRSGYSREELLRMRIPDLDTLESPEVMRIHIDKVRREGSDLFETRHRTKEGEIWPVEVNAAYWAAAGGRFFAFLRDLGERKRTETEMQDLRDEMERLTRFQVASQTAAAIAHELNQPLNAVTSYAEAALRLLNSGNPQPGKLRHAVENSAQQAQRAGNVVRELLTFLNQGEVQTEPVDLNEVVSRTLAQIQANAPRAFHCQVKLEPELAQVNANRVQVEKVLANLIQNGIEAMQEAGIKPQRINITVRTHAEGEMAQVTVRDSGPGIDAHTLHRIFDPFFSTKPKGLGMGLAISRAMIEAQGGQLWFEPRPETGAIFHFTLPCAT